MEVNQTNFIKEHSEESKKTNNKEQKGNYYIIADHLRTTIFALADGAEFEPKGRGYILKKLVKRAVLLSYFLNFSPEQLLLFSQKLIEINGSFYTHLKDKKGLIIANLEKEISYTFKFIQSSTQKIAKFCQKNPQKLLAAEQIFFWYDTAGIPLELIEHHLKQKGCNFSHTEFDELLEKQKQRGKEDREKKDVV